MTVDANAVEETPGPAEVAGLRRLLSVPEAAAYLGVSERWLYDEVREGRLPAMYIARSWRIRPDVLETYADSFAPTSSASVARSRGQVRGLGSRRKLP